MRLGLITLYINRPFLQAFFCMAFQVRGSVGRMRAKSSTRTQFVLYFRELSARSYMIVPSPRRFDFLKLKPRASSSVCARSYSIRLAIMGMTENIGVDPES